MKKALLITSLLTAGALTSMAQTEFLKQYFYTAGGNYSDSKNRVKVAVLKDSKIKTIDSVPGSFSNFTDIYYDKSSKQYIGTAHIGRKSGNDLLVRYDLDTYDRLDSIAVTSPQAMAQTPNRLLVAKAYINNGSYVDIYNAKSGKFITEVYGISNNCTDIKIYGDSAFVSNSLPKVSNIYQDSLGYLSIVRVSTGMLVNSINLGPKGAGIDNLILRKEMDNRLHIYFSSNQDSLVKVVGNMVIHSLPKSTIVEVENDTIYSIDNSKDAVLLEKRSKDGLKTVTVQTQVLTDQYANTFYFNRVNKNFLFLVSDFASASNLSFYSMTMAAPLATIDLGVSATALQPDYRPGVATSLALGSVESDFTVYPNPFKDQVTIQNKDNAYQNWEIVNLEGVIVAKGYLQEDEKLSTENFSKGIYLLNLKGNNSIKSVKIIKQ